MVFPDIVCASDAMFVCLSDGLCVWCFALFVCLIIYGSGGLIGCVSDAMLVGLSDCLWIWCSVGLIVCVSDEALRKNVLGHRCFQSKRVAIGCSVDMNSCTLQR